MSLTPKQRKFCQEYVMTGSAADAYRAAYNASGMKDVTVRNKSSDMLKRGDIRVMVEELQKQAQERTDVTIDKVVKELAKIGFHDIRRLYNDDGTLKQPHELDDETAAAVTEITVQNVKVGDDEIAEVTKYKFSSKESALDKLMKHLGGYNKDNAQKISEIIVKVEN